MLRDYITRNSFLLSITFLSLIFTFTLVTLNRSFTIGAIVGILFLLFVYQKIRVSKVVLVLSLLTVIAITLFLSFYIKSDSSLGRLLIYKISFKMFLEHPITGIAWGNFQREYNLYQAAFFKSGNYTQKEFLLADNTFYAFNDYWQLIVETGLVGGLCLITFIIFLTIKTYIHLKTQNSFLIFLISILIVICVAAFFTHVFENKPFQIAIIVVVIYIIFYKNIELLKPLVLTCLLLTITAFVSLVIYFKVIYNFKNYQKLEQAELLAATGYLTESRKLFDELHPVFYNDIGFLKGYSEVLFGHEIQSKRMAVFQEIINKYTDNLTFLKIGLSYEELGMSKQAETTFLKAVYMVPNRFVPKQALYNFYVKNKQNDKATYWRKVILTMPVKIPSERIEAIKQTVKTNNF